MRAQLDILFTKNGVDTNMNADYWNASGVPGAASARFSSIRDRNNSKIGSASLDGQIKSLNLWKRALSAAEIAYIYDQGRHYNICTGTINNIDTHINDANKSIIKIDPDYSRGMLGAKIKHSIFFEPDNYQDRTGNSTVTLHNSPTIDSGGLIIDTNSKYASFTSEYGNDYTIAFWVNYNSNNGDYTYLIKGVPDELLHYTGTILYVEGRNLADNATAHLSTWSSTFVHDQWTHIVIRADSNGGNYMLMVLI